MRTVACLLLLLLIGAGLWLALGTTGDSHTPVADALPAGVDAEVIRRHNAAVGLMGEFDFRGAAPAFAALVEEFPDWLDVRINHGIALLNRSRPDTKDIQRALAIMLDVLRLRPGDLRASQCAGIMLLHNGKTAEALAYFEFVAEQDKTDAYAAYFAGDCCNEEDRLDDALRWFAESQKRDPYLRSAFYGTFRVLRQRSDDVAAQAALAEYQRLKDNPQARLAEVKYTRMGPHGMVLPIDLPGAKPAPLPSGPIFESVAALPIAGDVPPWRTKGGDVPASITACDVDADGHVDLFLAGALEGNAPNAVLLRRDAGFLWVQSHPLSFVTDVRAVLWGDVDNDGLTDAYLCRRGPNQLWRQKEGRVWEEVAEQARVTGGERDTSGGLLADIDHDGDLDILLTHVAAPLEILMNLTDGTFRPLPDEAGLVTDGRPATGLLAADFDGDRDVDLVVMHAQAPYEQFRNDRLWSWERVPWKDGSPRYALCAVDTDADGRIELLQASGDDVETILPFDCAGRAETDLLYVRKGGWRVRMANPWEDHPSGKAHGVRPFVWSASQGYALVGFGEDGAPLVWKPGPGRHAFAAVTLSGKQKQSDQMRSNAAGIGTRIAARVASTWIVRSTLRAHAGPGQSLQPVVFGLVGEPRIDYVDLLWPDGLIQSETALEPGAVHRIEETQRQTSSCPVLFAWDGTKYAFVTDLLGVGGVGFWVAPGVYAPPAPQEALLLPEGLLKPRGTELALKLGEPMEESCYLDGVQLEALDVPPGWHVTVDDRMAVEGPAPTGRIVFYRECALPMSAVDQAGRHLRGALLHTDLKAAPTAPLDDRFIGRTAEHVLTLAFDRALDEGPGSPVLIADGWVEYPYAQTMFAAWQAGAAYEAPTIEAKGADGVWKVVIEQYGYPAGMPRESSVPLEGLPQGTRTLRIRTTQEVYWDRLAVAWAEPCPTARTTTLPLTSSHLGDVGFAKRTTAPQRLPHYDYARRAPLWDARYQTGFHTRLGPVDELLAATDDAVVIFGPGEEVDMRFALPAKPAPEGWTRRYVLRTTGWCKDMDLFTKDGETVGPLPVRAVDGKAHEARARLHPRYQTRFRAGR